MSGMTPAQAAYEGMRAQAIADGITEPLSDRIAWEGVERWQRGRWDAAAQAVLNQALPALRQQIADLKRERDEALSLTGEILAKFHTASRSLTRAETEPATYGRWRRRWLDARDRAQSVSGTQQREGQ